MFTTQSPDRLHGLVAGSSTSEPLTANSMSLLPSGAIPELVDPLQQTTRLTGASESLTLASDAILSPSEVILFPPIWLDAGNTLATAQDVGGLDNALTRSGYVGSTDTLDYYSFSVGSVSPFNLSLTGMSADADVRLIRDDNGNGLVDIGEIIASSARGGNRDEAINLASLAAGTYFIGVSQYSGNTSYTLRTSNTFTNNLLPTETDIGALAGTRTFSGTIDTGNTSDTYRFSVTDISIFGLTFPTGVNVTLSGLSSDADVRLIQDSNNNGFVDGADVLAGSYKSGSAAEWMSNALSTGTYFLQVNRFSGNTDYHLSVSTGDWYSANLTDAGVIGEARFAAADGQINRNDMLSILRETKDYSTIDATELTDLRKLLSDKGFLMPGYVKNLTHKVINSDPANPRSGIGNLFAGSSATQMEQLIGKWFLGNDRPTAASGMTYRYVSGSLFQGGIGYLDVDQNASADCYFLSSLGAAAFRSPSTISNMFIDNGDGTYTVRFFNNGVADYVTVDRYMPTSASGYAQYAGWGGGRYDSATNELWVALAEKAYAQINESGWIGQDNTNTYAGIDYGWHDATMRQITGLNVQNHDMTSFFGLFNSANDLISSFNAGKMISLCTNGSTDSGIVGNHCYTLIGYNSVTDRFRVYNPWNYNNDSQAERWISRDQLLDNFSGWVENV